MALKQAGFILGLLLFVPLGVLFDRGDGHSRRGGDATELLRAGPAVFSLGLVVIAVQLLIPFAAHLAAHTERGQVVGGR